MAEIRISTGAFIDKSRLQENLATSQMSPDFWEGLGRTVATFGYLEEVLGKAIGALTSLQFQHENLSAEEHNKWRTECETGLWNPLGKQIAQFEKAMIGVGYQSEVVRPLIESLKEASGLRNMICHASWKAPDDEGRSHPYYIDKNKGWFGLPYDIELLDRLKRRAEYLSCDVISVVSMLGYQFPTTGGPGQPISTPTAPGSGQAS